MCTGGGGGDGGAAEREQQRQQRIDQATSAVNAIFGVSPGNVEDLQRRAARFDEPMPPPNPIGYTMKPGYSAGDWTSGRTKGDARESTRAELDAALRNQQTAGQARRTRDQIYGQVGADTRDYFSRQFAEDAEKARRDMRFAQARGGTFGSSQAIDMQREYDRRSDRGLLDVGNRADSAVTGLRDADERARIDLISRIVNGADQGSATSSALTQLSTNAESARQNAQSARMTNAFAGLLDSWGANRAAAGEAEARRQFEQQYGNYFDSGRQYQGTTTR